MDLQTSVPRRSLSAKFLHAMQRNRTLQAVTAALVLIVIGGIFLSLSKGRSTTNQVVNSTGQANLQTPVATTTINRSFPFDITDASGKNVGKITYTLDTTTLQNQIILQGQTATAIKGRIFLIVNIKLTNNNNQNITLNSRDYVRLSVNGKKEWLAPDIHNDPVVIQAISTKYTRLGFPVNVTDKNMVLQVGEINGKKDLITLSFK